VLHASFVSTVPCLMASAAAVCFISVSNVLAGAVQLRQQEQMQVASAEADQAAHVAAERRVAAANASAHAAKVAAECAHRRAVAMTDAAEVAAAASSAMLTEDPSSGRSALSPLRQVLLDWRSAVTRVCNATSPSSAKCTATDLAE
jgi:hypothetical protein